METVVAAQQPASMPGRRVHAPLAYLPSGWTPDVTMTIGADGRFEDVRAGAASLGQGSGAVEPAGGVVLPGMVNAHSHAFQRAMLGLTYAASPEGDNFWSWRTLMYELALRLTPAQVEAIAAWVYTEMLRGGYTHVCEFHYLHNAPDGRPYADPAELSRAVLRAAARAGIGITLLPVLYMAGGFGGQPPRDEQRRFLSTPDRLLELIRTLTSEHQWEHQSEHRSEHRTGRHNDLQCAFGLAPHSLRAVPPAALREALDGLARIAPEAPIHIHIAEQTGEVDACVQWSGKRPVEWLLDQQPIDVRWNLVHATHMTADESSRVAAAGATVVLCPTTEADLGDGTFAFRDYASRGGRFAIGSDSQVSRDWQSELRMLEYSQRLLLQERNVGAMVSEVAAQRAGQAGGASMERSTGEALFTAALSGGAAASGRALSRIEPGARADWVVVREDKLAFAARPPERYLDSLIFDHHPADFIDVVVAGRSRRASLEGDAYRATRQAFVQTLNDIR